MDQVTAGWEESTHKHCLPNRLFLSTILSKIWLSIGPFFAVLPITLLFLVRFRPIKYRIEALDVIYPMVRRWLAKFNFCSGQHLGQTLVKFGQPWSNLVKVGQTSPNFGKCALGPVLRFFWCGGPLLGQIGSVKLLSNLVNLGQSWSTLLKLREMCSEPRIDVLLMWWVPIRSDQLSPGCLILRADTRENPGGKNRVMTVAPSLFGVSWHKEHRT